jgi:hypothetical protein
MAGLPVGMYKQSTQIVGAQHAAKQTKYWGAAAAVSHTKITI